MAQLATCAICGAQADASSMELTGLGLRCNACAIRAQMDIVHGRGKGMAEHLTRPELEDVVVQGGRQALLGVGIAIGGVAGIAAMSFVVHGGSGRLIVLCLGAVLGGIATAIHGVARRRVAASSIRQMPDARVVR